MNSKIVSIIIPTYNYGHLITETLTCLTAQSYTNWEAIIVDDGSTDNTQNVVNQFLKADHRFSYIKQLNTGVSAARNTGLKLAKGKYIQLLDADDHLSKDKIKLQVDFLEKNKDIDICLVATRFFDSNNPNEFFTDFILENKTTMPKIRGDGHSLINDFLHANLTVVQCPLFKKNALIKTGHFREGMSHLEDWDFWFRFATHNLNFAFLEDINASVFVRIHPISAMQQSAKIFEAGGYLRMLLHKHIASSTLPKALKEKLILKNKRILIGAYKTIIANTPLLAFSKLYHYYREINDPTLFFRILIKAINIKRKLIKP